MFCGRQTSGAHNIVTGLFDMARSLNPESEVLGFMFGTKGLCNKSFFTLTSEFVANYRNQGGMHMLGR